jgi:uncharacterized iron-regulated protein
LLLALGLTGLLESRVLLARRDGIDELLQGVDDRHGLTLSSTLMVAPAASAVHYTPSMRGACSILLHVFLLASTCLAGCKTAGPGKPPAVRPGAGPAAEDLGQTHPLRGRIWDAAVRRFIDEAELDRRLVRARYLLLGEKHDNPRHHQIQARAIRALTAAGRRPAVAWEMITPAEAPALDAQLKRAPRDAAGLGAALRWEERGWPAWTIYRPVAEAALDAGLPLVPAGVDREALMAMAHSTDSRPPSAALPTAAEQQLRQEVRDSHCGHANEKMVQVMSRMQQDRDAQMAARMADAASQSDGAVLIAGNGHVRRDRGVPFHLLASHGVHPNQVVILAPLEVRAGRNDPATYPGPGQPFDYIWFTTRVDNIDPCERFREQLLHMHGRPTTAGKPAR